MAAPEPEPPERTGESHHRLDVAGRLQPPEGLAQIGEFALEPGEPARLLRSSRCGGLRFLGQRQVPSGVPAADDVCLTTRRQSLEGELAHRLQHREARLALEIIDEAHQVVVNQRREAVKDVNPDIAGCLTYGCGRVHGEPADEDPQAPEERLHFHGEQPVTPSDRVTHRLLAGGRVAGTSAEQPQWIGHLREQRLGGEDCDPCRS
jgi:hypothetical protein